MRATVLLPEPDSPTSPSVSPRAIVKDTSSTTRVDAAVARILLHQAARLHQRRYRIRVRRGPSGSIGGMVASVRRALPRDGSHLDSGAYHHARYVSLAGKTALITGASAGIGWATALAFADKGRNLVVTARREERLRELCAEYRRDGGKAVYLAGDAAEEATAQACVALAIEHFGRLDILINNAGAGNYKNLVDTSVEEYDAPDGRQHEVELPLHAPRCARHDRAEARRDSLHLLGRRPAGLRGRSCLLRQQVRPDRLRPGARRRTAQVRHQGGNHLPRRRQDRVRRRQGPHRRGRQELLHDGAARGRRRDRLRLHAAAQCAHPADDRPPHGRAAAAEAQPISDAADGSPSPPDTPARTQPHLRIRIERAEKRQASRCARAARILQRTIHIAAGLRRVVPADAVRHNDRRMAGQVGRRQLRS